MNKSAAIPSEQPHNTNQMGLSTFDQWSKDLGLVVVEPLSSMHNTILAIDATYYLQKFLSPPSREPLTSALGGFPLGLSTTILKELTELQTAGCKLIFVFDGLVDCPNGDPFGPSIASAKANSKAFDVYEQEEASEAISVFRSSGIPTTEALSEYLKKILHENNIKFRVAPFSALAQLAYFSIHGGDMINAVMGPSELFLYGIDRIITSFTLARETYETVERGNTMKKNTRFVLDDSTFSWLGRQVCLTNLGSIAVETFNDACLLAGSGQLETFPPLKNSVNFPQPFTFPDVVSLLMSCGQKVQSVCKLYQDDPSLKDLNYLDRYLRASTAIRNHIVITKTGAIEPLDKSSAPDDLHDCVGLRLPEELIYYVFRGMIRPRVLSWLTSGTVLIPAPYEGGDSPEYRNLVKVQLRPLREQALCLIAYSMNYYYQQKEITTKYYFGESNEQKFNLKDLTSPKNVLSKWRVKEDLIRRRQTELKASESLGVEPGTLHFAIRSLADLTFAAKTISSKASAGNPLKSADEIVTNTVWRFLQLRHYIDEKHDLTSWGRFLKTALTQLGSDRDQAEAVLVAVELIRFGLLTPDAMFPNYSGAPLRGTDEDKRNCMLLARIACTGKIRHKPKGYTGPLSRHLLAYYSMVGAIRASLRDLVEMCLATIFLNGEAERDREDMMQISLSLPFHDESNCALGIVAKTYLDELSSIEDPTSKSNREHFKGKGQDWLLHSDFERSVDAAFKLWDALYQAVDGSTELGKYHDLWSEVNEWLAHRR